MSDELQKKIKTLRTIYSIAAVVMLLLAAITVYILLQSSMVSRRIMLQMNRAQDSVELMAAYKINWRLISDDQLAEVCIKKAMEEFGRKNYKESRKYLKIVIDSDAHIESRSSALFESANLCFHEGDYAGGIKYLEQLINDRKTPDDFRIQAVQLREQIRRQYL